MNCRISRGAEIQGSRCRGEVHNVFLQVCRERRSRGAEVQRCRLVRCKSPEVHGILEVQGLQVQVCLERVSCHFDDFGGSRVQVCRGAVMQQFSSAVVLKFRRCRRCRKRFIDA